MVAASLLGFYREGWEPMTPIDTAAKADKRGGQVHTDNHSFLTSSAETFWHWSAYI